MKDVKFEYLVEIPSIDTAIYMQDGDGSQLLKEDRAEGYIGYVDYEVKRYVGCDIPGDGGIFMYKEEDWTGNWTDMIPETIKYALDLEDCPEFYLKEVAA